ncbi:hypothetical protein ACFX2A_048188 [Malus domestica]
MRPYRTWKRLDKGPNESAREPKLRNRVLRWLCGAKPLRIQKLDSSLSIRRYRSERVGGVLFDFRVVLIHPVIPEQVLEVGAPDLSDDVLEIVEMFLENGGGWLRGYVLMHSTLILKSTGQTGCNAMTLTGVDGGAVLLMLCSPFSFALWAKETQKAGY